MNTQTMRGHACCDKPLETHEFVGSEFLCGYCKRPRALHESHDVVATSTPLRNTYPIRSPQFVNLTLGPLTDKKIEKYMEQGWYSEDFRQARRERMNKKKNRQGNFVERDGRMIYAPL